MVELTMPGVTRLSFVLDGEPRTFVFPHETDDVQEIAALKRRGAVASHRRRPEPRLITREVTHAEPK